MDLFDYTFIDNQAARTLFLLHGTGGSKSDFLFLDQLLQKRYNLVGLQGNIDERGMPRFFRRFAEGEFDQESIKVETGKLDRFISQWQAAHQLSFQQTYCLGYSNGANILLALLAMAPDKVGNFILLHAMLPFNFTNKNLDLSSQKAFVTTSQNDPIITPDQSAEVIRALQQTGINLTQKQYLFGHQISDDEIEDVVGYLMD